LLSSVLVLNVMRQVNDDTLDKLGAVAALSRLVQGDVTVFPKLFALVRDFELSIEENGFSSLNDYFENLLEPEGADERDATRASIKGIFKQRQLLAMETPSKADKLFLNSWNTDEAKTGMGEEGDFQDSFKKSADLILQEAIDKPKCLGSVSLGGNEFADLADEIVNSINYQPVDLHSALHSIFDGVCRRACTSARDEVSEQLHALGDHLPMREAALEEKFQELVAEANEKFAAKCQASGVPEDDATWKEHMAELDRSLVDKKLIVTQDNEKKILELISAVTHKYEDELRAKVDEVIDKKDLLSLDLASYIEEHDQVVGDLVMEYAREIAIASDDVIKASIEKFQKHAKDLRSRNIERVRLMQLAEAEKKQKFLLAGAAVLIIVAIGIDGDPFDELLSVLRLLWFLPILCMGGAAYFFMYGTPPPYTMQAATTVMKTATEIISHIKVPEPDAASSKDKTE